MGLDDLFIDSNFSCKVDNSTEYALPHDGYGFFQLLFLMCCYGAAIGGCGAESGRLTALRAAPV